MIALAIGVIVFTEPIEGLPDAVACEQLLVRIWVASPTVGDDTVWVIVALLTLTV